MTHNEKQIAGGGGALLYAKVFRDRRPHAHNAAKLIGEGARN